MTRRVDRLEPVVLHVHMPPSVVLLKRLYREQRGCNNTLIVHGFPGQPAQEKQHGSTTKTARPDASTLAWSTHAAWWSTSP